jgi:hypothetical protein
LNGDVAAGWPTVVALGAAEGVGVVAGGGGVVTLAGAAGLAVRACDRGGAVTVTVGTVRVGAVCDVAGGASGVVCGVVCGAGVAGVSDAGGLLVGGGSGAGVCDAATPVKHSNTTAELLRRCKRLLRIHMTAPQSLTGNDPSAPRSTHHGETTPRRVSARPSLARGRAGTRSMSGRGRCACREQRALRGGEIEGERRLAWPADGNVRQRQGWRLGKDQGAGKMDQGTDCTAVVRSIVPICRIRWRERRGIPRIRGGDGGPVRRYRRRPVEMHVAERQHELERKREQRQIRPQFRP